MTTKIGRLESQGQLDKTGDSDEDISPRSAHIGLAGEFRVMSELLLRGHNPAKSYLEYGADIVLENGLRLEVKAAHILEKKRYMFDLTSGRSHTLQSVRDYDFFICWCIDHNLFYIIPKEEIKSSVNLSIYPNGKSKYNVYRAAWNLLKGR